jgi:hypothetical protein
MTIHYDSLFCSYIDGTHVKTISLKDGASILNDGLYLNISGYKDDRYKTYQVPFNFVIKLELINPK